MRVSLKYITLSILWIGLHLAQAATVTAAPNLNRCQDQKYVNKIHELWNKRKPVYTQWISNSKDDPYNLYNIQIETNNLLIYAGRCRDTAILAELLSTYLPAINTLKSTGSYLFYYYPISERQSIRKLPKLSKMWLVKDASIGNEILLSSAQFLYLIADAINIISEIDQSQRTPLMTSFLNQYTPVLIDHYQRWVFDAVGPFQVRGWGCKVSGKYVVTGMNHQNYLIKSLTKMLGDKLSPSYCNAVTDTDMLIIAGVTKLIEASKKTTLNLSISTSTATNYLNYIKLGARLLETRITLKNLNDFNGKVVQGANFDLGVWNDYEDYKYAGYALPQYPKLSANDLKKYPKNNVGWDLSHARRFVNVFQTLYENKDLLGLTFPTQTVMQQLANQFVYGTFNGNFEMPLFTNYMDGSNGWYRVGYGGRVGFGYAPNDQSIAALTGGYGFLSEYNPDIGKLFCKMEIMINSKSANILKHVSGHYESTVVNDYVKTKSADYTNLNNSTTQSNFLNFYPVLYNITNACF